MLRKNCLTKQGRTRKMLSRAKRNTHGDVAQLGEHHVRNVGVVGSNPIISTTYFLQVRRLPGLFCFA